MRGDDHGRRADQHDGREIPFRIKAQIGDQEGVHRMGIKDGDPGIAIPYCPRRRLAAKRARRAWAVFHHHRHAQFRRKAWLQ